jgi:hypothetical protein
MEMSHLTAAPIPSATPVQFLQRSGLRPLQVRGDVLIQGIEASANQAINYAITVFENGDDGFVASLTCSYANGLEQPRRYAKACANVDDAVRFFKTYRPIDDVPVSNALVGGDFAGHVESLTDQVKSADTAYGRLVASLFPDLTVRETAEEGASCQA